MFITLLYGILCQIMRNIKSRASNFGTCIISYSLHLPEKYQSQVSKSAIGVSLDFGRILTPPI